ncbi:unnamed protein product [Heterobilharzia americana]|nr:unnamed protein product [Heterobilharzia americana]
MSVYFVPREVKHELKQNLSTSSCGSGDLSDDKLLLLYNIFGDLVIKALTIVECGSITIERSKSQHQVFRVESSSGELNYCSSYTRYCRCFNTMQKYLDPFYELWCQHTLAIFLAEIMGKTRVVHLNDETFCRSLEALFGGGMCGVNTAVKDAK